MRQDITLIALISALALSTMSPVLADYEYDGSGAPINMHLVPPPTEPSGAFASAAAAQTRSATNSPGPLLEAVCFVGGGPVWGGTDPDPNIRRSLLREFGGFTTVYMGKARPGSPRCEPAR